MSGSKSKYYSTSIELEVASEIRSMQRLDHDKLAQELGRLPMPAKFRTRDEIPKNHHLCSEQELLHALLDVFERFPAEEDFGLWSTVANAIELFEGTRIQEALIASFKRQRMWKTAELTTQYCSMSQIRECLHHCQEILPSLQEKHLLDFAHILKILEDSLAT